MLFLPRLITVAVFLSGASLCLAQDWYQVEVIVFEHSEEVQSPQMSENWPNVLNLYWPSPLVELEPAVERQEAAVIKPAFEELAFEERRLNNDSYAIRVRDDYNLLWHKAWRAPILPEEQAPWVMVQAGELLGEHYRLEGAIRVHLSRYLHLHTNLWLTEVTGEPIVERPASANENNDEPIASFNLDKMAADVNTQSRFDWSQLPEVSAVRWGCNYVRELWPEDTRLLPVDFHEDPAPADWYFPFGCRIPAEIPGKDLPLQLNYPTSNFLYRAEIEQRFPEFVAAQEHTELYRDKQDLENIPLEPIGYSPDFQGINSQNPAESQVTPFAPVDQAFLPAKEDMSPRVRYQVDEIVHIQSQRRMRSAEFHYIDHPKVGILTVIYPVEKPELDSEVETP